MQIDLSGRTALVTGSTDGIGFAIATGLARAGAIVAINGRRPSTVAAAVQAIAREVPGAIVRGHAADAGTAQGCALLAAAEPDVDILINNVGIYGLQDFFDIPDGEWTRFFETNVMSGVRLSRALVPGMLRRNWGRVVFVSSESGLNIPSDMIHYGFTKTAVISIARGLAKRLAGSHVTVNSVLPGPTLSVGLRTMLENKARQTGESIEAAGVAFVKSQRPSSILQRPTTPEEVANLVVYVCSPQASATTGAALRVDGGVIDTIA